MKNQHINSGRRDFLKALSVGAVSFAAASCGVSDRKEERVSSSTKEEGPMTMRTNHNTGDEVSILGYGMMRLPMLDNPDGNGKSQIIDQEKVNELVDYAMAHGVNYYDTSPVYCQGKSEEATGIALSRYPRDKYFIATKLSNFSPETHPREKSIEMFENSLKYLQTDYVDYLLLHSVGSRTGMQSFNERYIDNGILDYLVEQKKAGRIRNLGFSFHGDVAVYDMLLQMMDEGKVHWDFVQIQLNYVDWNNDPENHALNAEYLYNELAKRDIPAVIMEPLLGGSLAKVPAPIERKLKARRPDDSVATWAFRFAGTPEKVLTVLSGMTYMEHLQDNLRTYCSLEPCSEEEQAFLRTCALEYMNNKRVPCTGCQYCMPCPYGIDIPGVFSHYNKCLNQDNLPRDKQAPSYAKARKAYLVGYDRVVPKERQASRCISCGECISHCPQKINIPEELKRIDDYTSKLKIDRI